ncbi:MAG: hypothetical protein U0326_12255 [Polyangiales bacterium]
MTTRSLRPLLLLAALALIASCGNSATSTLGGPDASDDATKDGAANDGANDGNANDIASDGAANDGANDGAAGDGSDDGASGDGSASDGSDDGASGDGSAGDGSAGDGSAGDGSAGDGATGDASGDAGAGLTGRARCGGALRVHGEQRRQLRRVRARAARRSSVSTAGAPVRLVRWPADRGCVDISSDTSNCGIRARVPRGAGLSRRHLRLRDGSNLVRIELRRPQRPRQLRRVRTRVLPRDSALQQHGRCGTTLRRDDVHDRGRHALRRRERAQNCGAAGWPAPQEPLRREELRVLLGLRIGLRRPHLRPAQLRRLQDQVQRRNTVAGRCGCATGQSNCGGGRCVDA